jgi:hypothetical protein
MTALPCECAHTGECLEKVGGEQGDRAEDWEITRLRNLLRAAEYAAASAQRDLEFLREQYARSMAQLVRTEEYLDVAYFELAKRGGR